MKHICLIIYFGIATLGCSQKKAEQKENVQLSAYRLIDENRSDEAISLLTGEIETRDSSSPTGFASDSETKDLRVTLASAYARKAGISIFEIARSFDLIKSLDSTPRLQLSELSGLGGPTSQLEKQTVLVQDFVSNKIKILETLAVLPRVSLDKLDYLIYGVRVLQGVPNLNSSDLIYKSILNIVIARTYLDTEVTHKMTGGLVVQRNSICYYNFTGLYVHFLRVVEIILTTVQDLNVALPERRPEIARISDDLIKLNSNMNVWQSNLDLTQEITQASLESFSTALGFRLENSCDQPNTGTQ